MWTKNNIGGSQKHPGHKRARSGLEAKSMSSPNDTERNKPSGFYDAEENHFSSQKNTYKWLKKKVLDRKFEQRGFERGPHRFEYGD